MVVYVGGSVVGNLVLTVLVMVQLVVVIVLNLFTMSCFLAIWKMRNMTLFCKSSVIKSLALSKLLHVCYKIHVPDDFVRKN